MKKKMKFNSIVLIALLVIGLTALLQACSSRQDKRANDTQTDVYTCSMHPQVQQDKPGSCPICGMTLIKKNNKVGSKASVIGLQSVLQPINSTVIASIQTVSAVQRQMPNSIHAEGYIDFDTRSFSNITARFSGRIEKLYIKSAFEEIKQGQRIMDIYSPEMVTAQQDYLFLLQQPQTDQHLLSSARQKLLLLGFTTQQLNTLCSTKQLWYSLPVYSNYSGHVHDAPHNPMAGFTEANANESLKDNTPLAVKEGMYVQKGQTIFNVVDAHRLWAILKINQADANAVKVGQQLSLRLPDDTTISINARVDFIEPVLQNADHHTSARVYLPNHQHHLKVNSLVSAQITAKPTIGLFIPRQALLQLGRHKVVWLKKGALFKAKQVQTGSIGSQWIQVTGGLSTTDTIAADARYLVDSESFILTQP